MVHELKTWPEFFEAVVSGVKPFEVRRADRQYSVGDTLWLREWNPTTERYGPGYVRRVSYVLRGGQFGIEPGYVVLGLAEPGMDDHAAIARYRAEHGW